jgi:inner membrane protein
LASAPTHIVASAAVASCFYRPRVPWTVWLLGAALAVAPDLDVLGLRLGVPRDSLLGHRGLTHSLPFALLVSGLLAWSLFRAGAGSLTGKQVWLFLFLAMALHGALDALTNGGPGIAFFSPFSARRYFFPFRPLEVSPLSVTGFFTARGLVILRSEVPWVWLPTLAVVLTVLWVRARGSDSRAA